MKLQIIFQKHNLLTKCPAVPGVLLLCRKYRLDISGISTKPTSPIESAKLTLLYQKMTEIIKMAHSICFFNMINDILLRNSENSGGKQNEICKNRNGKRRYHER